MNTRILDWRTLTSKEQDSSPAPRHAESLGMKVVIWTGRVVLGFFAFSLVLTFLYGFLPVPITPLMVMRIGEAAVSPERSVRFKKDWVSLDEMSTKLQFAVIAAEDAKFFEHGGFDWEAIAKAMKYNERGRKVRGGSTISQQVAKNVFLWPQRSWVRKALEAYFTFLIETFWTKKRIIEVYLNVVELGDGVYGVEAASNHYFRKSAAKLSSSEAALIAAVLPNPRRYSVKSPTRYVRFRQTMIQRRMPSARETMPKN